MMVITPKSQMQVTDGLLYQLYDPDIHCFLLTDTDKRTIDATYRHIVALDADYAKHDKHLQYLYVLQDISYTPYMLWKLQQASGKTPSNLKESAAVVADSFLARVLEMVIMPKVKVQSEQMTQFFSIEEEAFDWFAERRAYFSK